MAQSYEGYKTCFPGDLVINSLWAWSRGLGFSEYHGLVSTAYSVYRPDHDKYDYKFLHYLLRTKRYVDQYLIASKGIWISRLILSDWAFLRIPIISPPKEEQTAIATFLDHKTAQIDRAIAQKERLIELLQERKQIVIQQAVTKGLDPTVKMKDSGVEWMRSAAASGGGEVPEHWEVKKLKYVFTISGGGTPSKENPKYWNGDIPWVSPKDMKSDYIYDTIDKVTLAGIDNSPSSVLPVNSLLLVVRSGILQHTLPVAITKVLTTINQDIKAFRSSAFMLADFLMYYIRGNNSVLLNNWVKTGATVESVEVEQMMNDTILVPPLADQKNIVASIGEESFKINHSIDLHTQQIAKLREYRTVLIDAAVTGKIKVV